MAARIPPFRTGRCLKGFGEEKKTLSGFLSAVLEIAESYLPSEVNTTNDFSIPLAGICKKKSAMKLL